MSADAQRGAARRGRLRGAAVVLAASALLMPVRAGAAADLQFVPTLEGTCTFSPASGDLTLAASPPIRLSAVSVSVTISGTGTCAGNAGVNVISLSLSGSFPISCAEGSGTLFGTASWSGGLPNTQSSLSATVAAGPGTLALVLGGAAFSAVADLGWDDPVALASCATSGTGSTGLSGDLAYASQS